MLKFSVLLPIYHREIPSHFNDALSSIWDDQTLKPNEIILIKDGALTPELDKAIDQWGKKLDTILNIISLPENIGLGQALNAGIKAAKYNILIRMDSDDISSPKRFEQQISFLKTNSNVAIVGGQMAEFENSPNNIISERLVPLNHTDIIHYSQTRSPFNHATIAYRKDILEKVGLYQHHLLMEDYNLWIRILAAGYQTANLPDTLLYMRTDGMHGRRRGWQYVKSEWQLFKLKRELNFQSFFSAFSLFLVRSSVRLLPASLLQKVYGLIRKK